MTQTSFVREAVTRFDFLKLSYRPRIARLLFSTSIKRRPVPEIEPAVRAVCRDLTARFEAVTSAGRGLVSTSAG